MSTRNWVRIVQGSAVLSAFIISANFFAAYVFHSPQDRSWVLLLFGPLVALPHIGIAYLLHADPGKRDALTTIVWGCLLGSGIFYLLSRIAAPPDSHFLTTVFLVPLGFVQGILVAGALKLYATKEGAREYGSDIFFSFRDGVLSSLRTIGSSLGFVFGVVALVSLVAIGYDILRGLHRFLEAPIGIKPGGDSTISILGITGVFVFGFLAWLFYGLSEKLDSLLRLKGARQPNEGT